MIDCASSDYFGYADGKAAKRLYSTRDEAVEAATALVRKSGWKHGVFKMEMAWELHSEPRVILKYDDR